MLPLFLLSIETCHVASYHARSVPEFPNPILALSNGYHSYPHFTHKGTTDQGGSVIWQRFYRKRYWGIQSGTQKQA